MKRSASFVLPILAAISCSAFADDPAPGKQVEQNLPLSDSRQIAYLLALPAGYGESGKLWPVMLFLHGRGESNGPLSIVAKWGPPRLAERGDDLPYILVSPQCPAETNWGAPEQQAGLLQLLDHVLKEYSADPDRVYLTGLSCGAYGAWMYLAENSIAQIAAMVPIAGPADEAWAAAGCELGVVPIWAFHGDADDVVPIATQSVPVGELAACPSPPREDVEFTAYPGVDHDSWTRTYDGSAGHDIYTWMLDHSRSE